jgi:hypothetical protein
MVKGRARWPNTDHVFVEIRDAGGSAAAFHVVAARGRRLATWQPMVQTVPIHKSGRNQYLDLEE